MSTSLIFQDLFYVWLVGLMGGLLAHVLKQPLLLGYMLGGLLISPFTPGPAVQHPEMIQHLAQFGVVLLMFSLGLELAPVGLRRIRQLSLAVGTLMPLIVVGMWVMIAVWLLGWPVAQSVVVGCALSISSTMAVTKMLMERGETQADYGQTLLGTAIIEDCLIMGLLLFLPMMADPAQRQFLSIVGVSAKTVALLVLIFTLGLRVVPPLLEFVGRARDAELSILVLLVLAMGIGVLGVFSGLSLELGAFVAGLVLSGSETTSQTMGRMLPMRDLFVVTFFVSLGILLDPSVVASRWPLLAGLLGIVLGFKMVVVTRPLPAVRVRLGSRVASGHRVVADRRIFHCPEHHCEVAWVDSYGIPSHDRRRIATEHHGQRLCLQSLGESSFGAIGDSSSSLSER